ncbi:MAG: hypothetical protein DCC75_06135, partial [Proteobacteria bacterium]
MRSAILVAVVLAAISHTLAGVFPLVSSPVTKNMGAFIGAAKIYSASAGVLVIVALASRRYRNSVSRALRHFLEESEPHYLRKSLCCFAIAGCCFYLGMTASQDLGAFFFLTRMDWLLQALIGLTFLILLWVGGLRLMRGELTLGTFVMFNTYLSMLIWPMIAFGWVVNLMQRGNASLKRIAEFMGEVPEIASPASPTPLPSPFQGRIEFRSVAVRYDGTSALSGIDLTIPAGATVAVVGHTGSGKTSLVRLVSRLMDPSEGAVLLDGVDAREFSPADVRSVIGMVPQETFLFSATLAENIAFGVKEATEE